MRRALFEAWRQTVDETDVIICLGDVTVGPANPPIDEALAALPGETILVAGNHDVAGGGKDYGFEAAYGVCAGFDAQGRDIGQLRERMAHFEGPPRADVRTDAPDRGAHAWLESGEFVSGGGCSARSRGAHGRVVTGRLPDDEVVHTQVRDLDALQCDSAVLVESGVTE